MSATEDFVSAALRHTRDAERLLAPGACDSRDQAWHLAGFAHECARKACLRETWVPKLLGHGLASATELIVDVSVDLDPHSGRLPLRRWSTRHPAVAKWSPEHRYERTGASQSRDVEGLVASARAAADEIIVALWLDGRLEGRSLQ